MITLREALNSDVGINIDESTNEITTTGNLNTPSVNTGQGDNELYEMDQGVKTTDSPNFAGLTIEGVSVATINNLVSTMDYKGGYSASDNTPDLDTSPSNVKKGDFYTVTSAGTFFTTNLEIEDVIIAEKDDPTLESDWTIINKGVSRYISSIAPSTYSTLQDWFNTTQSAGIIEGGSITDNGDGTITVSAGKGIIKTTNSDIALGQFFDFAENSSLSLTDNSTNYIAVDYNSGTPQTITGITNTANGRTIFNLGKVYKEGTTVDIINAGLHVVDLAKRIQQHHIEKDTLDFVSGAVVGETGTRNITVSSGVMYAGLNRIVTDAVDTSDSDDFELYYYNGSAWVESDATQIDNLQYNNIASGLATLNNNQYGVFWVFKGTGTSSFVLYGQDSYTLTEAQQVNVPSSLPPHVSEFSALRAKIIIQKSSTSFTEIQNVANTNFQAQSASDHANLANLQGGTTDEYYHLTAAQITKLDGIETGATADQTGAEILAAFESETGRDVSADGAKIDRLPNYNDIGIMGLQGAGVGICPTGSLPTGFTLLPGTETPGHDNWGNYQFKDGSIMCYIPPHWIKIGTGSNGFGVNVFSVLKYSSFTDESTANAAGYFLPRCFKDGGETKLGYFVDKYQCSKNAYGTGYVASSIKNGLPLSTSSTHNPIADLTACAGNYYYEAINAAKARDGVDGAINEDSNFFCCSRFIYVDLAMLSMAHGQAATSTTYCAWYDATGAENYPKGCNDNALGDYDDATVAYVSDGYPYCGKTGSGTPFAKTTHNGQNCGVADLNGNMYEISIGVTSDGTKYYVADESTAMKDFTSGNSGATDHWGTTGIAAMMTEVLIPYMAAYVWKYMGSGTNQVLSEDLTGNGALLRSLGIPKDSDGYDATGTNQFGKDGMYNYQLQNELCVRSGGAWNDGSGAGVWGSHWSGSRSYSSVSISFRLACFPV